MLTAIKSYTANIVAPNPKFVIGAYAQLWRIQKSFRMSEHDLRARPIYHHKRESIDAHVNMVFAALAVTRLIEARTGWSIKKFVQPAATEPSRSAPENICSPPRTRCRPSYATLSLRSSDPRCAPNSPESGSRLAAVSGR